jgi:hypothetical protein
MIVYESFRTGAGFVSLLSGLGVQEKRGLKAMLRRIHHG